VLNFNDWEDFSDFSDFAASRTAFAPFDFVGFSHPETSVRDKSGHVFNGNPSLTQRVGSNQQPASNLTTTGRR
jgi:hypothetical protein